MSIEESIEYLEESMRREQVMLGDPVLFFGKLGAEKGIQNTQKRIETIKATIALLRTHPDAQTNEPLTLEELREMDGQPVRMNRMDWISVEDRLPDKLTKVWAYKDGGIHVCRRCSVGSWESLTSEDTQRYGRYWTYGPSHWIPLPPPPKED